MTNEEPSRIIHTNLFSDKAKEVCSSVLGQLSDGWGENNSRYESYWKFALVTRAPDGEILIKVSEKDHESQPHGGRFIWTSNAFKTMNDTDVKNFFARMIKKTASMELHDNHVSNGWKRHNTDFTSQYMNYRQEISIAEIYAIYEHLLGRDITSTKYAQSVIQSAIGERRNAEDTSKAKEIADKKAEIEKRYTDRYIELREAEQNELEAIKKKYGNLRTEAWNKYHESMSAFEGAD